MPENTPISVAEAGRLTKQMSDLSEGLEDHREDLKKYRRAVRLLVVAVAIGVVVAVVGAVAAYRARTATEAANQSRDDARVTACINFNVEQQGDRSSVLNGALVTFGLAEAGELTAADRAEIVSALTPEQQSRYAQLEKQAAFDNPFRDCSAAGIKKFYDNPPADPARLP